LLEISRAISQELDLDKLLERILTISLEMLAGQAGLIALRAGNGGWQIRVSTGLPQPFLNYLEPQLANIPEYEDPEDSELYIINQMLNTFTQAVSLGRLSNFPVMIKSYFPVLPTRLPLQCRTLNCMPRWIRTGKNFLRCWILLETGY